MFCAYLFLTIVGLKFFLNLFRLIGIYICYHSFKKQSPRLAQYIVLADRLLTAAGANQYVEERTDKTVAIQSVSYFLTDKTYCKILDRAFQQAIGAYKLRLLECINPYYWLFLPEHLAETLGYKPPKLIGAIMTLVYWVLTTAATVILETVLLERYGSLLRQFVDMLP